VPVPVDVDLETLSVSVESLESAVTPRTRAVLIAHLFGSRMPLDEIVEFARSHGLVFIEDCAQAFTGDAYRGHPHADVSLFSFGPIKTATALGGGLLRFRNAELAMQVRNHMRSWPVQSRASFLVRLARFGLLKALSARWTFTAIMAGCRLLGIDHDEFVGRSARGFPGGELLAKIRRRPSAPLLALLKRRITNYAQSSISERIRLASLAIDLLPCETPGSEALGHSYWVFAILHDEPDLLMRRLAAHGFDATRGASSLYVVEPPADRPQNRALKAEAAFDRLLYLPVYPGVSPREIERLADAVLCFDRMWATTVGGARPSVSVRPAAVKV
jgi:dTDP-4-amino-4,6-dideoxygalactose transaminase